MTILIKYTTDLIQELLNDFNYQNPGLMKIKQLNLLALLMVSCLLASCNSKPRVIESQSATADPSAAIVPISENVPIVSVAATSIHEVTVEEILNTEKYSYLFVSEKGDNFWIAISKRDVSVGDTYFYKGGLLKKNFFSKEFNRVFETVYLVSNIWKNSNLNTAPAQNPVVSQTHAETAAPNLEVDKIEPSEGAISLAELFANKSTYNGKLVKITGKCVKLNPMIMNRNWLHIQDGSGEGLDLTVTTTEVVRLGEVISLEGTIALDKDFGAGYRYDIIMEGASLK